jgi:hypothetical protein
VQKLGKSTDRCGDKAQQQDLDRAADVSAEDEIRQGLEGLARGRTRPAREVFAEIRETFGIPTDGTTVSVSGD